jgi:hypothetical protein
MLCNGNNGDVRKVLRKLDLRKKDSFLQSFLGDVLFWEKQTDLWAKPESTRRRKRRKPGDGLSADTGHSRKSDGSDDDVFDASSRSTLKSKWKTAKDPRTGRTYYYDSKTRVPQWEKPAELEAFEKKRKEEKRKQDIQFFKEIKQNILESIRRGELIPGIPLLDTEEQGPPLEPQAPSPQHHVRTISTMDGSMFFVELGDDRNGANAMRKQGQQSQVKVTPSQESISNNGKKGRPPLPKPAARAKSDSMELPRPPLPKPVARAKSDSMELPQEQRLLANGRSLLPLQRTDSVLVGEKLLDAPLQSECDLSELGMPPSAPQTSHARRNTGGTIFLENTMTKPDIQATMKCVCGVYRAHIVQGAERKSMRSNGDDRSALNADVFLDDRGSHRRTKRRINIPKLSDVLAFYEEFYRQSKMEHDTIIMSLIYVERLVKATNGGLNPTPENWRSILFACMVLASKVWDDLSMWNVDFSNVSTNTAGLLSFSLRRINELELALLKQLTFDVRVGASEYAKYYFLIRTMLIRSGLVQENGRPLRKQEAFQKLETLTKNYQATQLRSVGGLDRRSKSMDANFWSFLFSTRQKTGPVLSDSVCLEQIVG